MSFGFQVFRLTDGTTTLDLLRAPYGITGDGPDIGLGVLRPGELGGAGPYTEQECTVPLDITGACTADVYTAYTALWTLLDQAQRWWRGQFVDLVKIEVQAAGSGVSEVLMAVILRRNDDESAPVGLPPVYEDTRAVGGGYVMTGVELRFVRRAQWLRALDTATGSAQNIGTIFSATLATHPISSPLSATLAFTMTGAQTIPASFLLLCKATDKIVANNASGGTATGYTAVNDSGNNPRGGTNILRYTPTGTAEAQSGTIALGMAGNFQKAALFAVIRTNTAAISWGIRAITTTTGNTPVVPLDYVVNPRPIFLGIVAFPEDGTDTITVRLAISVSTITGSPTFDIDYLAAVAVDDETSRVLAIDSFSQSGNGNIIISDRTDSGRVPQVVNSAGTYPGYDGDAVLATIGTTVAGLWLACQGASATSWRLYTGSAVSTATLTANRRRAYLVLP